MIVKLIQLSSLSPEQIDELSQLCRTTRNVRLRTRAQIILLAVQQGMSAPGIAEVVRESDQTVRNWLKRYETEGIEGLKDAPRPGSPNQVTLEYVAHVVEVVRRRPSALALPFSLWTLARLADYITEKTGIRVSGETVRRYLKEAEFVLSRPQQNQQPDPGYLVKKMIGETRYGLKIGEVFYYTDEFNLSWGYLPCRLYGALKASRS